MNMIKKLMLGATLAVSALGAQAAMINVGGVTWNPEHAIDFSAASVAIRQHIDPGTGVVSGYGILTAINGDFGFCPGCQVTFQFSGFTPSTSGALPGGVGTSINYTGGNVDVFVNHGATTIIPSDATTLTLANTGVGNLWLGLSGHAIAGASLNGSVTALGLSGTGQLDVKAGAAGGMARSNFDTNALADGADLAFGVVFNTFLAGPGPIPASAKLNAIGSGTFYGNSIPEPGSLALIGLGLLGAAVVRRRKA